MKLLKVGVFGTSLKQSEKRVAIHPGQLEWIDEEVRKNLVFERGYGRPFGFDDEYIAEMTGGLAPAFPSFFAPFSYPGFS
ncbi:MAG: hypothetical protein GY950_19060 [bacterium]|nr:hypothetical protein [bacterium]